MQSPFANLSPVVKNLLIINIICFLPSIYFSHNFAGNSDPIADYFGVYYLGSPHFKPWQIITYMFIHGGWGHIFFNMFTLYSFGSIVEYSMGSKRFLMFYFICGFGAILLQLLVQASEVYYITGQLTMASPELDSSYLVYGQKSAITLYGIFNGPMVGASGAIVGVLMGFRILYPEAELMVMFIPVPVKAKYIVPAYILLEIGLGVSRVGGDNVAHFAHLGGALIGYILIKSWRVQGPKDYGY
jgi:membrane associated rhomboid family serine protease